MFSWGKVEYLTYIRVFIEVYSHVYVSNVSKYFTCLFTDITRNKFTKNIITFVFNDFSFSLCNSNKDITKYVI